MLAVGLDECMGNGNSNIVCFNVIALAESRNPVWTRRGSTCGKSSENSAWRAAALVRERLERELDLQRLFGGMVAVGVG